MRYGMSLYSRQKRVFMLEILRTTELWDVFGEICKVGSRQKHLMVLE
jgi:hypothetical protein